MMLVRMWSKERRRREPGARALLARLGHVVACVALLLAVAAPLRAQMLLVPMDDTQRNHLKAYGLVYGALKDGQKGEWLLNYRGGAFFLPDLPELRRRAAIAGVVAEQLDGGAVDDVRREIAAGNMDAVPLEKAPTIAI